MAAPGDGIELVRDGFRPLGFVLPVVWLVVNRLWLPAALMFAAMGLVAALAHRLVPAAAAPLLTITDIAFGMITALEGPAWLSAARERRGAMVEGTIIAANRREAEEYYAANSLPPLAATRRNGTGKFQPVSPASLIPLTGV